MNKFKTYSILLYLFLTINCNNAPKEEKIITDKLKRIEDDNTLYFDIGVDVFQIAELKQWDKTQSEKIKKITFYNFDSIPIEFQQFLNVETIRLGYNWQDIYVPDIFPNLREIELDMVTLIIEKNARFKKSLQVIKGGKSSIKSISSFSELPKLKILNLGFSNFDPFPTDMNTLQFLEEFIIGAYTGSLDISNLRLSQIKSLKKVVLHTHYENTITGFPNDISTINKQIELRIEHNKLTKEQKKILKEFKKPK